MVEAPLGHERLVELPSLADVDRGYGAKAVRIVALEDVLQLEIVGALLPSDGSRRSRFPAACQYYAGATTP